MRATTDSNEETSVPRYNSICPVSTDKITSSDEELNPRKRRRIGQNETASQPRKEATEFERPLGRRDQTSKRTKVRRWAPGTVKEFWQATKQEWSQFKDDKKRRFTHAGRIHETADGEDVASPCTECSKGSRIKLGYIVYTDKARKAGDNLGGACGTCRKDSKKCLLREALAPSAKNGAISRTEFNFLVARVRRAEDANEQLEDKVADLEAELEAQKAVVKAAENKMKRLPF